MASPSPRQPIKLHLPLALYTVILLVLIVLLVLDLDYKTRYVGPADTNSFHTTTFGSLRDEPIVSVSDEFSLSENALSSWPHFLSSCENFTSFDSGGGFTVLVLGSNCSLGYGDSRLTRQNIIAASTVKLDSIVWTCCKLLFPSQQPSICQDHISTDFLNRYMFPDITVGINDLAKEGSTEEKELTTFLDMVSRSYPLYKVVCLEGFIWPNETSLSGVAYHTTIYGCASPNAFRSEFIGIANPKMRDMLAARVWLSADTLEMLGLSFGIRQNSKSYFTVEKQKSDGKLVATAHVSTNFSCFGLLYSIMIGMDVLLLLLYLRTAFESLKWVLGPHYKKVIAKQSSSGSCQRFTAQASTKQHIHLSRVALGSISTSVSSIQPSEFTKKAPKARSTSSLHASALLHSAALFDATESFLEDVVHCSLYSHWLVVGLTVGSQLLSWLLVLPDTIVWSWSLLESSKIRATLSNIRSLVLVMVSCDLCWAGVVKLNEEFAYFVSSRTFVSPLEIVLISSAVTKWKASEIGLILDTKWQGENQRVYDYMSFPGYIAHGNIFDVSQDFLHGTPYNVFFIVYQPLFEVVAFSVLFTIVYLALKGVFFYIYQLRRREQASHYDAEGNGLHGREHGEYHRLSMELLLDFPVRARCLMRNNLSMEILVNEQRLIRPSCYLDAGILPRDGNLEATPSSPVGMRGPAEGSRHLS